MVATIVSSKYVSQTVQADGRISVEESFTDSVGAVWGYVKLLPAGTNLSAQLTADGNLLLATLKDEEIQNNIFLIEDLGSLATPTFNYSTQAQNQQPAREAYRIAQHTQAVMIGDFLNTLTDAQLMNIFNMTQPQVTNLRNNKLIPASNTATSIRASSGA